MTTNQQSRHDTTFVHLAIKSKDKSMVLTDREDTEEMKSESAGSHRPTARPIDNLLEEEVPFGVGVKITSARAFHGELASF